MDRYDELIAAVEETGETLEFFGPQKEESIAALAQLLGVSLPPSYIEFLKRFGGGGTVGSGISGIYGDMPQALNDGTAYGDTIRTRTDFALPDHLIVVYRDESDAIWCLDTGATDATKEYPVVAYDAGRRRVSTTIAASFADFFENYLRVRAQP